VPALLDEVHRLIESRRLRFVLSGSSARKRRRGGTNLLAGRAEIRRLYPLVSAEIGPGIDIDRMIEFGSLPLAVTGSDPKAFLRSYALTYLQEEIRAEALTRNLGGFARFLEVAARQNAQLTNAAGIARDVGVSRQSVQNWFEILGDTLLGSWLPAWKLKRATKQVSHPKFYLFDSGVARALSGRLPYPVTTEERGGLGRFSAAALGRRDPRLTRPRGRLDTDYAYTSTNGTQAEADGPEEQPFEAAV
jgi:predicted AAA+ superfamily ATPase